MVSKDNYAVDLIDSKTNRLIPFNRTYSSFYIDNGTEYKIILTNNDWRCRANAKVFVNGQYIGTFRIQKNDKIEIDGPVNHDSKLISENENKPSMLRVEFEKEDINKNGPKIYSNIPPSKIPLRKSKKIQQLYEVEDMSVDETRVILETKMVLFNHH
jgi:hypothetical protein